MRSETHLAFADCDGFASWIATGRNEMKGTQKKREKPRRARFYRVGSTSMVERLIFLMQFLMGFPLLDPRYDVTSRWGFDFEWRLFTTSIQLIAMQYNPTQSLCLLSVSQVFLSSTTEVSNRIVMSADERERKKKKEGKDEGWVPRVKRCEGEGKGG